MTWKLWLRTVLLPSLLRVGGEGRSAHVNGAQVLVLVPADRREVVLVVLVPRSNKLAWSVGSFCFFQIYPTFSQVHKSRETLTYQRCLGHGGTSEATRPCGKHDLIVSIWICRHSTELHKISP